MNRNHSLINHIVGRLNTLDLTKHTVAIDRVNGEVYAVRLKQVVLSAETRKRINGMPEVKDISLTEFGHAEIRFDYTDLPQIGIGSLVTDVKDPEP